jgi:hypothetical protein
VVRIRAALSADEASTIRRRSQRVAKRFNTKHEYSDDRRVVVVTPRQADSPDDGKLD